jgi:hypothetical protein
MDVSRQMGANMAGEELLDMIEQYGARLDPRLGKVAGIAAAALLTMSSNPRQMKKAGKKLRRRAEQAARYVRKHPWETAALLIGTGIAAMKGLEGFDNDADKPRRSSASASRRRRRQADRLKRA